MKKRRLPLPLSLSLSLSLSISGIDSCIAATPASPSACIAVAPSALPHRSSIALPLPVSLSVLMQKMTSGDEGMEGVVP